MRRTEHEPHDRLTALADAMVDTLRAHGDATGSEVTVIMLADHERAGTAIAGFGDDSEAVAFVLRCLDAILKSQGKRLVVLPLREG